MSVRRPAVMLPLFVVLAAGVSAQDRPFHIDAAIIRSHQPAAPQQYPRVSPPLAGDTTGVAIGFGRELAEWTTVEGEVLFTGTMSVQQGSSQSYQERYVAEARSTVVSTVVKWRPGDNRFFALVVGGGFAWARIHKQSVQRRQSLIEPFLPRPPQSTTDVRLAISWGADASLPISGNASLIFPARMRWTHHSQDDPSFLIVVGRRAWHVGAGVRVRF